MLELEYKVMVLFKMKSNNMLLPSFLKFIIKDLGGGMIIKIIVVIYLYPSAR